MGEAGVSGAGLKGRWGKANNKPRQEEEDSEEREEKDGVERELLRNVAL